jgi:putative membrane protein
MWNGSMMGWGGGMFGLGLPWWVLIVIGIVVVARWLMGDRAVTGSDDRALSILKERFARGEIDKAEFEARKRDLT